MSKNRSWRRETIHSTSSQGYKGAKRVNPVSAVKNKVKTYACNAIGFTYLSMPKVRQIATVGMFNTYWLKMRESVTAKLNTV